MVRHRHGTGRRSGRAVVTAVGAAAAAADAGSDGVRGDAVDARQTRPEAAVRASRDAGPS